MPDVDATKDLPTELVTQANNLGWVIKEAVLTPNQQNGTRIRVVLVRKAPDSQSSSLALMKGLLTKEVLGAWTVNRIATGWNPPFPPPEKRDLFGDVTFLLFKPTASGGSPSQG
jgi:hypothetical protein